VTTLSAEASCSDYELQGPVSHLGVMTWRAEMTDVTGGSDDAYRKLPRTNRNVWQLFGPGIWRRSGLLA